MGAGGARLAEPPRRAGHRPRRGAPGGGGPDGGDAGIVGGTSRARAAPRARDETRGSRADVTAGSASLSFLQFKGGDDQRSLTWFIESSLDTARVTAVHMHRGAAGQVGEVLFAFPNGYSGPGSVITQSGPQLWSGTVDYEELFQAIRDGGVYVDVHTLDHPEGELRGQLSVWRERGWQDSCTD